VTQLGTYVLLAVGDAESGDDSGPVGDAGPGVAAAAVDDPDAEEADEAGPAGLERDAPAFDVPLEHPAVSARARTTPSAGTVQERRTRACIGRWYGNYIH
jgi:hypothetical protein